MGPAQEGKPLAALWQDYLFLTREMLKFLTQKLDFELFMELMSQRERLQVMIEQHPSEDFVSTLAGQSILREIDEGNQAIRLRLMTLMGKMREQEKVSRAYDAMEVKFVGKRIDYQK